MVAVDECSKYSIKLLIKVLYFGHFFASENIYYELLSLINTAVYLFNTIFVGWVLGTTVPVLCQKCDFFLEKSMKEMFAYVLEFMLTFDKMQNTNPLMCTKFGIWGQGILEVIHMIQAFHTVRIVLYIGCSGPVVECLNKIKMKQSTTQTPGQNTQYTELSVQYEEVY